MNVFVDLDGPILNNLPRLYGLYSDLLTEFGFEGLSEAEYWAKKRSGVTEEEILRISKGFDSNLIQLYNKQRFEKIEANKYLELNNATVGCYDSLHYLSEQGDLILITERRNRDNLKRELLKKNLDHYFRRILCNFDHTISPWKSKAGLIQTSIPKFGKDDIIIGDTEADILCGKELEIYSIGLTNGIRNLRQLLVSKPDRICKNMVEVVENWSQIKKDIGV